MDSGATFTSEQAARRWLVTVSVAEMFLSRFADDELVRDTGRGWQVTPKGLAFSHELCEANNRIPDNSRPARRR